VTPDQQRADEIEAMIVPTLFTASKIQCARPFNHHSAEGPSSALTVSQVHHALLPSDLFLSAYCWPLIGDLAPGEIDLTDFLNSFSASSHVQQLVIVMVDPLRIVLAPLDTSTDSRSRSPTDKIFPPRHSGQLVQIVNGICRTNGRGAHIRRPRRCKLRRTMSDPTF
jgi:hypothetical protein